MGRASISWTDAELLDLARRACGGEPVLPVVIGDLRAMIEAGPDLTLADVEALLIFWGDVPTTAASEIYAALTRARPADLQGCREFPS